jgi:hypothetical protein
VDTDSSSARDDDQHVDEDDLPTTGVDREDPNLLVPQRIQINFLGAHRNLEVLDEIVDVLIEEAEKRGLIFEYGGRMDMDYEQIIPGSRFEQIVTGRPPRIQ